MGLTLVTNYGLIIFCINQVFVNRRFLRLEDFWKFVKFKLSNKEGSSILGASFAFFEFLNKSTRTRRAARCSLQRSSCF